MGSSRWLPKLRQILCSVVKVAFELRDAKNSRSGVAENGRSCGICRHVVMSQYFPTFRAIVLPSSSGPSSPTKKN